MYKSGCKNTNYSLNHIIKDSVIKKENVLFRFEQICLFLRITNSKIYYLFII